MIEVKDLTKIYKSKKGGTCVALDHISFSLPDKGFVFIVGKSGSGKSTLLNMIGCLDTITSGDVIENGRSFAGLKVNEQAYYRNSVVGFIFQDFLLIDELTIFENVMLSLQLQGETDKEKVLKALSDTGLEEYANRYPKELSGGQKQRVAIARALVKNPRILLADEPTGNLDSKTTIQILELLKDLSQEKLVIIVSHNLANAHTYADEIIELAEGKILQHVKRNKDFDGQLRVEKDTLVIPSEQTFSAENIENISKIMETRHVKKVKQDKGLFSPCEQTTFEEPKLEPTKLEKKQLRFKDTAALSWKFARRSWLKMVLYSCLIAILMTLLVVSQLVMNFNGGEVVLKEMAERNMSCDSVLKTENENYESIDPGYMVDIEEGDIQKFYDAGYEGKIYELIHFSITASNDYISLYQQNFTSKTNIYNNYENKGLLITEKSFLENIYGQPLKFCAEVDEKDYKDHGIYLTDYFADVCLIAWPTKVKTYKDLLGYYNKITRHRYVYVNGIIDTGYKERYADLIGKLSNPNTPKEEVAELLKTDECLNFYDEIYKYLSIAYTFNPNFKEDLINSNVKQLAGAGNGTYTFNNQKFNFTGTYFSSADKFSSVPLNDNEVLMSYETYNQIFGTSYDATNYTQFVPHEVKFSYYFNVDENRSNLKYETTLKIIGLRTNEIRANLADNVLKELQRLEMFTFGLYFDNPEQAGLVLDVANENGFSPNSIVANSISAMTKIVQVFSRFFYLIFIVLCVCVFALLVQFSVKNIKEKMREIGVIKALGGRTIDLILIFGFQTLAVGVLMTLLFVGTSFLFVNLANSILVSSIASFIKNRVIVSISFLIMKWQYLLLDCLLSFGIIVASFIIPMLMLRSIKPTKVIQADE